MKRQCCFLSGRPGVWQMLLLFSCWWATTASGGAGEAHSDEVEAGLIALSEQRLAALGIETAALALRRMSTTVNAPGEVEIDLYRSARVTPRISAQVVERHARLGDRVARGQKLVTLSSVAMAEAQGNLVEADREWTRVQKLGRKVVSEKRYVAAQVARQRAYATVLAYGMSQHEVDELLRKGDASLATGDFDLLSPQAGTIIFDRFVIGEVVASGRLLFEVSDESVLWVEARLRPELATAIAPGSVAHISVDGDNWLQGRVVQLHHRLDAGSRTLGVRIEVSDADDRLHPGQYVQVSLETRRSEPRLAVPAAALVLMQGMPTVFRRQQQDGQLVMLPVAVETGLSSAGWVEIVSGLASGDEIAVRGAFTLKSLLLKSQIGDAH